MDKPARVYKKILEGPLRDIVKNQPFFIDCVSGMSSKSGEFENVLAIKNFDMEELEEAIELGLHKASSKYSGERFFVMTDNLAGLQYYTSPRKIRGFFKNLGLKLKELHIYGYFLVAEGQLNLMLSDMIRNLPQAVIQKVKARGKD
jgi:hypothetical protein